MTLPSQGEIILPLLRALDEAGGRMRPREVYEELADRFDLDEDERRATVPNGAEGRAVNAWERRVRNARQRAVAQGLVAGDGFNVWTVTEKARRGLLNCRPGVCVVLYTSEFGRSVFAECQTAVGLFDDASIDLLVTSPPYPLLRPKQYGNRDEAAYVEWLAEILAAYKPKLRSTASLFLNLGDVWNRRSPTMSLYQERLVIKLCDEYGYHLAERMTIENPSRLPGPAEWVTVRRVRVTPSTEALYWLSPTEHPKANNRAVLRPYSESMRRLLAKGGQGKSRRRPSGHALGEGAFSRDSGGSIPHNLLIAANTSSNDAYQRHCRQLGLPVHPARFAPAAVEFPILLTTDEGDHVVDIFGGSNVVGRVAERLRRRWTVVEKSLTYAAGGMFRFDSAEVREFDADLVGAALAQAA